jgi:peptidoglycan/LPS O-acetylase OafA/YrhL
MGVLRLLLALSVVMAHGLTTLFGSHLIDAAGSVWVFFAISGFLITIALNRNYTGTIHDLLHFYWNRAVRLFPSYWVWLVVIIAAYFLLPHSFLTRGYSADGSFQASGFWRDHFHAATAGTLIVATVANVTGFFADAMLRLGFDKSTGELISNPNGDAPVWAMPFVFIGQYWSIGVELCFYAIAPLLARRLWGASLIFLLSATGYAERAWASICETLALPPVWAALGAPKYLWIFMIGVALAHVYLAWRDESRRGYVTAGLVSVAMGTVVFLRHAVLFTNPAFPWWEFLALVGIIPLLFALTSGNKYDRFAGDLSYPIYVNHFLIIQITSSFIAPNGALYAVLTIAVAAAMIMFVERPSQRWKFSGHKNARMSVESTVPQYRS